MFSRSQQCFEFRSVFSAVGLATATRRHSLYGDRRYSTLSFLFITFHQGCYYWSIASIAVFIAISLLPVNPGDIAILFGCI